MSRNQVNNPDDLRKTVKNGKNKRKTRSGRCGHCRNRSRRIICGIESAA